MAITPEEEVLVTKLGEIWNGFLQLKSVWEFGGHTDDKQDFRYHIHRLQDMIMARDGYRQMRAKQ